MTAKPACCGPIAVRFLEDSSAEIMCRVTDRPTAPGAEGTPFVQSNFSAITYSVYDITDEGDEAVVSGHDAASLTISSVVFNSLQGWSVDTTGHNFRAVIGPTAFPTGNARYRIAVKFTHTDGRVGHGVWEGPCQPLSTQ